MTYIFEKTFGKFDSSTDFEGNKLIVEYVHSSVSDSIKVVQMWRDGLDDFGKPAKGLRHEMYWMSEEAQDTLMKELEVDMENRICGTHEDEPSYLDSLLSTGEELEYLESQAELHHGI